MTSDLEVLIALRVQGVAKADRLARALCVPEAEARRLAASLTERGLASERTGRVPGYALTSEGADALERALTGESSRGDDDLEAAYERFLVLNEKLLRIASDWQVRRHGPIEQPNDHSDPSYDQEVIDRLCELHDRTIALLRRVCDRCPRFAGYRDRLGDCVERLRSGDTDAFTAALAESYHTVWFELHQDLILTLGLKREV